MPKLTVAAVCLLGLCASLFAQDAAPAAIPVAPKSVVTGHVFCADTGLPARFANVQLLSEQAPEQPNFGSDKADFAAAFAMILKGDGLSALTLIDGSFRLENVAPGTYYVIPQLPGYLSLYRQFSSKELAEVDAETRKKIQSHAQQVTVEAGHSANVDVKLERGAALSGEIIYDDGSPALNVVAQLFMKEKAGTWKKVSTNTSAKGSFVSGGTDDRGHYRFTGLVAGEYGIMAELPVTQFNSGAGLGSLSMQIHTSDALQVYSGNVFRQREMKGFALGTGEERSDADLIFPVNGLFKVAGSVLAKRDNHPVGTGSVELLDPVDKLVLRTGQIDNDGTFAFQYVPAGEYVVHVLSAADVDQEKLAGKLAGLEMFASMPGGNALRTHSHDYGKAELPLSVHGDSTGLTVLVPEQPGKTPTTTATPMPAIRKEIPDSLKSPLQD